MILKALRKLMAFLFTGSGLLEAKPLLIWHPAVWLLIFIMFLRAIYAGFNELIRGFIDDLAKNKFRVKP